MIARRLVVSVPLAMAGIAAARAMRSGARRLGALVLTDRAEELLRAHLVPELSRRGWRAGEALALEVSVAAAAVQAEAAAALVATAPDLIVAIGAPAVRAARAATAKIPIVMHGANVRLLAGTSMARPGGNATGVVANTPEAEAKRIEMACEMSPPGTPVGALFPAGTDMLGDRLSLMAEAAARFGRELASAQWDEPARVAIAIGALARRGVRAVALGGTPEALRDAAPIARAAAAAGMATIGQWRSMVEAGCTASHGPDFHGLYARVAHFVALILRGTPPGELPIEAPSRVETVINLREAAALGLVVPVSLLARADEVIE